MARRRYRLFTICAVFMVFMLYRVAHNLWNEPEGYDKLPNPNRPVPPPPAQQPQVDIVEKPPLKPLTPEPAEDEGKSKLNPVVEDTESDKTTEKSGKGSGGEETIRIPTLKDHDSKKGDLKDTKLDTNKPTRTKGNTKPIIDDDEKLQVDVHWKNPPKNTKDSKIIDPDAEDEKHWEKPEENFPLPPGSMIPLPTGKPKTIPKIQYDFGQESEKAKTVRLQRQKRVKAELSRAWSGYRRHAWMHDELSPVSAKYRDPFCGWAATLVDSLDTLWIAGMKDEFDEAAKAVKDIDFTYSPRNDIPVFETTIRYLGGLLAAYDVSGGSEGNYPILLEKAVELAEILMGIFDTPNRMPVLYYRWRPPYSSQPHRASSVGIAELATLSMEFTRLAQLTGKNKYFDAVERITDGLVEMQSAGTTIPGLFPEKIDASGCNRTATTIRDSLSQDAQQQMGSKDTSEEPLGFRSGDLKAKKDSAKGKTGSADERLERRGVIPPTRTMPEDDDLEKVQRPAALNRPRPPLSADGSSSEWDCVPQGLVAGGYGQETYHMGGGQDSAYEYFQKQYLLLGGLEPKYQKLHEDSVDAIYEWLMFRPMIKDEGWDILFPAKVSTGGDPEVDLMATFEISHLTCFIGGMFGMGGKIFGREQDIETAKRLTDGCVWAYQSTTSGIMPEHAHIMPCPTLDKCEFNETKWWEELDPSKDWRTREVEAWEKEQVEKAKASKSENPLKGDNLVKKDAAESESDSPAPKTASLKKRDSSSTTEKKTIEDDEPGSGLPDSLKQKLNIEIKGTKTEKKVTVEDEDLPLLKHKAEDETDKTGTPSVPGLPYKYGSNDDFPYDKPLSHEEYIKSLLESERIPPGYSLILSRNYILRPEAIESVWYMYRITGDPTWMDKGWKMFEATVAATRTELANSAIDDVLSPSPHVKDEMESFWVAETLKYYYLLFSEPDLISLDEWVLNTEAHPFRRPS